MSFSDRIRYSISSTLISLPAYFAYTTRSPILTSSGSRLPVASIKRPLPTASTMPSCGFSLAVSGSRMPLLVRSSRSTGLMTTRSPNGRSFIKSSLLVRGFSTQAVRVLIVIEAGQVFKWLGLGKAQAGIGVERRRIGATEPEVAARWPRPWEGQGTWIALLGETVDGRPAGKGQPENARALIECLAGGIVASPSNHVNGAVCTPADEVAVTARHHETQHRRTELRFFQLAGEDVRREVTDTNNRKLARPGDRLGDVDADQQATDQ